MLRLMAIAGLGLSASVAGAQTLSTLGTPGIVDMPTAESFEDGDVALTISGFGNNVRSTFAFQVLPRVYGTFRYAIIRDFDFQLENPDRFDRSFDLHYQITDETLTFPGVAVGLRDFGGTGIYSGEYLVATKTIADTFKVTAGLGWGRLAQRNSFDNPLGRIAERFETRSGAGEGGISTTGQLDPGLWFRGPVAIFGGVEYQATDRLSFQLEYSTDEYQREVGQDTIDIATPFNFGLNYSYPSGSNLRAFLIGGTEVGLQYSFTFNPKNRLVPGGLEPAPLPIPDRRDAILASRDIRDQATATQAQGLLTSLLNDEGITLEAMRTDGNRTTVHIENNRWDVEAQAIGRTARVLANVLPANVDTFVIIPETLGIPNTAVTLRRADLHELQTDFDGAWRSFTRSQIDDAPTAAQPADRVGESFPRFSYQLTPYYSLSYFDPDSPVRIQLGPELSFKYEQLPGLSLNGRFRYPLVDTIEEATRESNSVIQRVRSDAVLYAQESDLQINNLSAEYIFRPGQDMFGRVSAGYLENMYGGVSGEVLWYPVDSRFALGLELNYARQRDFDMLFGFQDYDVITGHASGYYDFDNGFVAQVDVGRYLAGDWGATFSLDREFNNGFKIGGYFTLTDVPFEDFGEGSFDKGIRFSMPLSWLTGQPSRSVFGQTIQPVVRDGGARLSVPNRLYGVVDDYRGQNLGDGWGRFFR